MIATVEELKNYTEQYTDNDTQIELFIQSAQQIVENYIGYNIEVQDYNLTLSGDGTNFLNIGVHPVNSVTSISIDGESKDVSNFVVLKEFLFNKESYFSDGNFNIQISLNAGYAPDSIPEIMKLTVLRIAGVLCNEGRNVGIQSISDSSTGSRTFMERNFNKYLALLNPFRILKW
jgi:hypothetical protein